MARPHRHVASVEESVQVLAQQDAVRRRMCATRRVRPDVGCFENMEHRGVREPATNYVIVRAVKFEEKWFADLESPERCRLWPGSVLDRWACNCDGRQAVFSRKGKHSRGYFVTFIDQGYCLNVSEWSFPDSPLRGVYARNCVYKNIAGWDSFEPTLSRAEQMDIEKIWRIAAEIPEEWYESDYCGLHRLVENLYKRRSMIRDLIATFRTSSRNPFPNWREH